MEQIIKKIKNHEIWKFCCGNWFDKRNDEFCPNCKKK
jgi:hypothetical protein